MARTFLAVQDRKDIVEAEAASGVNDVFLAGGNVKAEWKGGRITWKDFLRQQLPESGISHTNNG
jgi:hypothetical protein